MLGFLYTVFEDADSTKNSISILRSSKYEKISKAPIIIVSTSKNTNNFGSLAKEYDCNLIEFRNAPGNNSEICQWISKSNPWIEDKHPLSKCPSWSNNTEPPGGLWRYNWLSMRILLSMEIGIKFAETLNIDGLLHLHSDTFWKSDYHHNIIHDYDMLINKNIMLITDIAQQQENNIIPSGFKFCPEGIMFNIPECKKYEYGFSFSRIYNNKNSNGIFDDINDFCCQDYCASEALLGQYAYFCLTHKNVFEPTDIVDPIFYNKIHRRIHRNHHGDFETGLVNVETIQHMGC